MTILSGKSMKMRNHVPHYSDGGREPRLESACLLVDVAELTSGVIYSGSIMDIRERFLTQSR